MRRVALSELIHRRSRTLALLAGILVATAAFTVLTGTARTQRLEARGTVARNFRGDYDVLVRPRGSRTAFERRTGQVQPNFLSGLFGGIRTSQWRRIQALPGVEVAAPIANLGYVLPTASVPIDVSAASAGPGRILLRGRVAWRSERGLTRVPDSGVYAYVTANRLRNEPSVHDQSRTPEHELYRRYALQEDVPGRRRPVPVCNQLFSGNPAAAVLDGPFEAIYRSSFGCFSRATGTGRSAFGLLRRMRPRLVVRWAFPLLLSAIDPASEARLNGLDRAVVAGRYLRGGDRPRVTAPGKPSATRRLPVLAASRTYVDEQAEVAVERLRAADAARWARPFPMNDADLFAPLRFLLSRPHGPVIQRTRVPADAAYRVLLRALTQTKPTDDNFDVQYLDTIWRTGPLTYARRGTALVPDTRAIDDAVWQDGVVGGGLRWAIAPPSARDTRFRELTNAQGHVDALTKPADDAPLLHAVGQFDPAALGGAPAAGTAPMSTLQPPELTLRGGGTLRPNGNLGGYLAQPPALLTTMPGIDVFRPPLFPDLHADRAISAIRVRVAGVTGIDALSRERIREAAERIAAATGLDVDITAGASGAPVAVDLPAGVFGRPPLQLAEIWVRKGVAVRVLQAVDRKSVLLLGLILVVCALFVGNAASAAVRARRSELGVLACLGWPAWRLFAVVLAELGLVGLAAGVLGGLLALPLAGLAGVDASLSRAALAVPAATGLSLLAGLLPAARAARAHPLAAVRPPVLEARRGWHPRRLWQLALLDLVRAPGRTVLGSLSLGIGVCALTLLLAAGLAFHDVLVGTLLGDAVAVTVRSTDYVAVGATILLGVGAVADVLFLNLRERAAELAALYATGWSDAALARLVVYEGLWIGALGALVGGGAGLGLAALFAGALPPELLVTTAAAALGGVVLTGAAALAPGLWLRRAPLVPVLAGE